MGYKSYIKIEQTCNIKNPQDEVLLLYQNARDTTTVILRALLQKINTEKKKWLIYASKIMYNEDQGSIQPPTKNPRGFSEIHQYTRYESRP